MRSVEEIKKEENSIKFELALLRKVQTMQIGLGLDPAGTEEKIRRLDLRLIDLGFEMGHAKKRLN